MQKIFSSQTVRGLFVALAILALAAPARAQGTGAPQAPAAVATPSAPAEATVLPPVGETPVAVTDDAGRASKASGLRELSPWSMFMSADIIVKAVMIGLAFASLVTWTVFLGKTFELLLAGRRLNGALARIGEGRSLAEAAVALKGTRNVAALLVAAAVQEVRASAGSPNDDGIKERAASRFTEILRAEARIMRRGMGLLATIGATSPFVGLFGTVWGIMNSFIGISKSQTTNLAVVAPGIAEALLATAIGLVAAIPAVIIYNHFSRHLKTYLELVSRASGAVGRLLSRDLERMPARTLSRAAE
jgi:biopolymer transport protein ExbB